MTEIDKKSRVRESDMTNNDPPEHEFSNVTRKCDSTSNEVNLRINN